MLLPRFPFPRTALMAAHPIANKLILLRLPIWRLVTICFKLCCLQESIRTAALISSIMQTQEGLSAEDEDNQGSRIV